VFDRLPFFNPGPVLQGPTVYLRPPAMTDFSAWAALRAQSRAFLEPWEPTWAADALDRGAFRQRVRRYGEEARGGTAHNFLIFRVGDQRLLGGVSLTQIRRGVAWTGTIGYWMGQPFAGQGVMQRAVALLLDWAFAEQRLHRVEAACLPRNDASRRVLDACGFRQEGVARGYLCINGAWEDHLLFAILTDDPRPDPRDGRPPFRSLLD
jgi:ribosomal-protein-alanine N-acetyltransferase